MQKPNHLASDPGSTHVVVVTHEAKESDFRRALATIDGFAFLTEPTAVLRMEDKE